MKILGTLSARTRIVGGTKTVAPLSVIPSSTSLLSRRMLLKATPALLLSIYGGVYLSSLMSEGERIELSKSLISKLLAKHSVKEKALKFFKDSRDTGSGLYLDRLENHIGASQKASDMASLAATGFGLVAMVLEAENNTIEPRRTIQKQTIKKLLNQTLDTAELLSLPKNGYFLPHFVSVKSLKNLAEISTVDTMIFYLGALITSQYVGGDSLKRVESMFSRLDFEQFRTRGGQPAFKNSDNFSLVLDQNGEFISFHWGGEYSEGVHLVNLLSLASDSTPLSVWTSGWSRQKSWKKGGNQTFSSTPLFTYFYGHAFLPLMGLKDSQGIDYGEESRNAVQLQIDYCKTRGYPSGWFGLSACDAPAPHNYSAYAPGQDDYTVALPAVIACSVLAPEKVLPLISEMSEKSLLDTPYGPVNAYNLKNSWRATDALGIDVGSMLLMLDSLEGGVVHRLASENRIIRKAMHRAGFKLP